MGDSKNVNTMNVYFFIDFIRLFKLMWLEKEKNIGKSRQQSIGLRVAIGVDSLISKLVKLVYF